VQAELGEGISVYYSKDWQFYEFNQFRAQGLKDRKSIGMFRTAARLCRSEKDPDDLLS
jgi:hypothetical protein